VVNVAVSSLSGFIPIFGIELSSICVIALHPF
jgi:hypothetical protein